MSEKSFYISIIGAILGFIGSVIPELLKLYKDYSDKKHEKEMYQLQLQYLEKEYELRIKEAEVLAQIEMDKAIYEYAKPEIKPTGFRLADTLQVIGSFLNTIVRPVITFAVFGLWLYGMATDYHFSQWESNAISCILVFWFGNRSFQRAMGRL